MRETIRIIIIEDDLKQQQMYKDTIEEYNLVEENEYIFDAKYLLNDEHLPKLLYEQKCDCLIIDLSWGKLDDKNNGNRVIKNILTYNRIPIIVMSGNLSQLEVEIEDSVLFKKHERTYAFLEVLQEIIEIYETGYSRALGYFGKIDSMINEVYWKYLSTNIDNWQNIPKVTKEKRILRYAIARINELLTLDETSHDNYNLIEFYITPPIRKTPFSGDIVRINDEKYIIVSAACDMEQGKNEFVVVCKLDTEKLRNIMKKAKEGIMSANDELKNYVNNSKSRYHLLPPCKSFEGALIDYQQVLCFEKLDFNSKCEILANVLPVFSKDIHSRFSQYYGRQGQPQIGFEEIKEFISDLTFE